MTARYRRSRPAVGHEEAHRKGLPAVACRFDAETFEQIRARAIADGTSFAEQIRTLVEWGLEAEQ